MPFSAMDGAGGYAGASAPLTNTEVRLDGAVAGAPACPYRANSGRSSAYAGPARMRAPAARGRRSAPALAPRFWLSTKSTGSGRSARSSMAISAAPGTCRRIPANQSGTEAVVVADDQSTA